MVLVFGKKLRTLDSECEAGKINCAPNLFSRVSAGLLAFTVSSSLGKF